MFSRGMNEKYVCTACRVKRHASERCWTVVEYPKWHRKPKASYKGRIEESNSLYGGIRNSSSTGSNWTRNRRQINNRKAANAHKDNENTGISLQQLKRILKNLPGGAKNVVSRSKTDDEIDGGLAGFAGMVSCHNAHINAHEWIIYSGAIDHMCGNIKLIRSSLNMHHSMAINLPNAKLQE